MLRKGVEDIEWKKWKLVFVKVPPPHPPPGAEGGAALRITGCFARER